MPEGGKRKRAPLSRRFRNDSFGYTTITVERPLRDEQGKVLHLRSSTQVRELLQDMPRLPCELVQHCAHDEMCGVRGGAIEPLRLPLSLEQYW